MARASALRTAPGNVRRLSNIIERLVLSIHSPATLDEGHFLLDDLEEGADAGEIPADCQMLAGDYKAVRLRILKIIRGGKG